jgi:hypothetical protein
VSYNKKMCSKPKFTRKEVNFECKTIPIGYLVKQLKTFRDLYNLEIMLFLEMNLTEVKIFPKSWAKALVLKVLKCIFQMAYCGTM